MELRPLCVMLLLTGFIHCTQTGELKATLTLQSGGTEVFRGENVTLKCEIKGEDKWTYTWFKNEAEISTIKTSEYTFMVNDEATFTCMGNWTVGDPQSTEKSDPVRLSVSEKPKPELRSDLTGAALTGNSVTLYCTLKPQSAGWKFYWSTSTQSSETESHDYTIRSVRVSDGGRYKCRAGRGNPVYYTHYSDALWVNVTESPKPVVIIKPDKEVFRGERVTFRCEIQRGRDTEWTYSWKRNDYTLSYRTTQEFSLDSVGNDVSGKYTCSGRRSDSQSSETSDAVTLTVSEKPKPTVSVNHQSPIYTGDTVTLSCTLQSTGWTFLWYDYQQSKYLTPDDPHSNTHTETVSIEGRIKYACKARRGNYDSEFSDLVRMRVTARPKPVVTIQPAGHVFIGETVTLTCDIETGGSWSYHWFRDNTQLSDASWKIQYTINTVQTSHQGLYTCNGIQSSHPEYTQTSDAVTLTVSEKPKPELRSGLKGAALTGNSVRLYCALKLQSAGWKFYWITPTQSSETETESHDYTIRSVRVSDGGRYKCRAGRGNPVYYTQYSDALWVKVTESPKPVVIIKPDKEVFRGERVTFRCEIQRGRDTEWTYSWKWNDYTLSYRTTQEFSLDSVGDYVSGKYTCSGRRSDSQSSETSDAVTLTVSEKLKPELTSDLTGAALTGNSVTLYCTLKLQSAGWKIYWITPTQSSETESHDYTIRSVQVSDGGRYKCRAGRGNPVRYTHYSEALWVNVIESPKPVVIIKPDKEVFRGERVTFRCEIPRGRDTEWTYSWKRNDYTRSYRTTQEFSLDSVGNDVSSKYTCSGRRSDSQSTETSDAVTLTVSEKPKPTVSVNPQSPIYTGDTVTLSCNLQSTGWRFLWYRDSQKSNPLSPGARDTNTLSETLSNEGQINYYCKAQRGNYDSEFSDPVTIIVSARPKPEVNIQPAEHVFTGESVTLTCDIRTGGSWSYHWYRDNKELSDAAGEKTYTIRNVETSHQGHYTCNGTQSSDPTYTQTSDAVTLTVSEKPKPTVSVNPQSPIYTGDTVTLSCNLQSTGWTFLWYRYSQKSNPLSPGARDTHTRNETLSNAGQINYSCKAQRGNYDSEFSDPVTIIVSARPKPTVNIQPAEHVFTGESVTLTCDLQTGGSWWYHWYRDNKQLRDAAGEKTYTIHNVETSHQGLYTCKGTQSSDPTYTQTSDAVTLTVSEKPKPELRSDLKGAALTGNSVTLYCTLKLQSAGWKFYWITPTQRSETESHDYTIRSVRVSDGGRYKCRAGRGNPVYYTHYSDALWVNVIESPKPVVIIKPDKEVFRGERVTFRCEIQREKDTEWTYSWKRNDYTLSYRTTQEFSLDSVGNAVSGKYTCSGRRSDSQSSETSDAVTLTVSEKPKPTVSVNPQSSIYTGDTVTLSCNLQSTGWTFLWYDYQQSKYLTPDDPHSNTLTGTVSNAGQIKYACKAQRGNYDSEFSDPVRITVRGTPKPVVTIQPAGRVFTGETVTFTCNIRTGRSWSYHWYRDNTKLSVPSWTNQNTIYQVKTSDKGDYTCEGTQSSDPTYTQTSDAVTLTVSEKPKPELRSGLKGAALTGNSVTLYCTLKLQSAGWKFYWITPTQSSETDSHDYTIRSVRVSDGGQYKCRAGRGNPVYYTHYSDALWVNVTESPKPVVIIKPDKEVFRGERVTFRCEIPRGRDTEWTYSWKRNDDTRSYRTTQEFSLDSGRNDVSGKYTCSGRRSDSQSSETSDAVTLTVSEKPKPELRSGLKGAALTGNSVTLYCTLKPQSAGWKFYWITSTQRSETESHDYTIRSVRVSDGGRYKCRAGRGNPVYYTHYSDALWVNVIESPKPVVIIKPDKEVFRGERVTFRCEIPRGRDTEWTYSWKRNDYTRSYRTIQEFSLDSVGNDDSGKYTCSGRRSDSQSSETSDAVTLTVSEKPKPELTSDLKGAALTGIPVTLYCTLKPQSAGWNFYWNTSTQSSETETESGHYVIRPVRVSDGGQYSCRAGRGNPVYYTHYSDALWVNVTESPKPVVIIKPDKEVFRGETVTFRCEIQRGRDTEWTYSWKRNDNTLSSRTTQEFSLDSAGNDDRGKYTCSGRRISDSRSSDTSDAVTLTVSEKPKLTVSVNPQSSIYTGDTVTLSCNLQSTGWRFLWYTDPQKSNPLPPGARDTNTLNETLSNEGQINYSCKAQRGNYDSGFSEPVRITVSARPKVNIQPAEHVFTEESVVTLTCDIPVRTGRSWWYHWYRDNKELGDAAGKKTYTIRNVETSHQGLYTCKGTQSSDPTYTQTSDAVTLTVSEKPKPELRSDLKGAALTGNSVTLYCTLKPQSAGWKFYWSTSTQSSETDSRYYTIRPVRVSDGGQYRCRAGRGNPVYYTHYSDALCVNVIERPKPVVIIKPDKEVFRGETVTFRCEIQRGRDTEWTYSWKRNDYTRSYPTTQEFSLYSGRNDVSGKYTCSGRRSDSQSSETSDAVTLTVSEKPKPELRSGLKGAALTGNSVTLYCTLKLQSAGWKFYWITPTQSSETESHDYTIRSVRVSDGGRYKCRAGRGNPVYYTHYSDALWVNVIASPKPVVIIKPDKEVFRGERVTFRCEIPRGRDTEWTYSWKRNDDTLSYPTTQEFSLYSVGKYDSGKYTCSGRRSDSQSSETSDAVTLTVSEKPKPELTSDLKGATLTGIPVTLYCTLKPQSAGWKFYWSTSTQSSETETESGHYVIRPVRVSDGDQYWCRAGRGNPVYYTHYSDALWVKVTGESAPVSLIISPSRTQHFTADSLSLSCEDQSDSTGWTVRRYTHNETPFNCLSYSGSTCNISSLSASHTGVYWCQSESGGHSNPVNITVHYGDVILDSPVHPVTEGRPLTLRCLYRNTKISESGVDFYKNDSVLQNQTTGEMTIRSVSKSDEGFYHCKHPQRGESPKSWVSVRVSAPRSTGLILGLSLAFVFAILMILMILLLRYKKKKGVKYQSQSSAVNQDTNQLAADSAAGSSNTVNPQVVTRKKKQNGKNAA
ncbi:obscurin-like [Neoarius graeffei]|uniref:obscurin-like n=1 Tax=Neoarius graeffei TaxID=443677 RepID=UPI00298CE9C7|nr:obscurin-like [Neoarius graeffei]